MPIHGKQSRVGVVALWTCGFRMDAQWDMSWTKLLNTFGTAQADEEGAGAGLHPTADVAALIENYLYTIRTGTATF
jgi:hypothetical protein